MIILLFLWIIFVLVCAGIHWYIIEIKDKRPNYLIWFIIKAWFSIFHCIWIYVTFPSIAEDYTTWFPILAFQVSSYWVLFSQTLNKMRGKDFWYLGRDSGPLDTFLRYSPTIYKFLYFTAVIVSVVLIIKISSWN